jgi:hypothetical protein
VPPRLSAAALTTFEAVSGGNALQAWVDARRPAIATVVGAAVRAGCLDPQAAVDALENERPGEIVDLTVASTRALGDWMNKVASQYATIPSDCGRLHLDLGGDNGCELELSAHSFLIRSISLDNLPVPLVTAIVEGLREIAILADAVFVDDLLEYCGWPAYELADLSAIKDEGLLDQEPAAIAAWAAENTETMSGHDEDSIMQTIEERRHWLDWSLQTDADSLPSRTKKERFGRWMIRVLLEWRKNAPELYWSPWTRFLRQVAHFSRKHPKNSKRKPWLAVGDAYADEGWQPLAFSHVISFGEPWMGECVDYLGEGMAQAGEGFLKTFPLERVAVPELLGRLESMAIANGLLSFAEELSDAHQ